MATKYELQPTAVFANQAFGENDNWEAAGLADVETYISEQYSERMELWAIE